MPSQDLWKLIGYAAKMAAQAPVYDDVNRMRYALSLMGTARQLGDLSDDQAVIAKWNEMMADPRKARQLKSSYDFAGRQAAREARGVGAGRPANKWQAPNDTRAATELQKQALQYTRRTGRPVTLPVVPGRPNVNGPNGAVLQRQADAINAHRYATTTRAEQARQQAEAQARQSIIDNGYRQAAAESRNRQYSTVSGPRAGAPAPMPLRTVKR